MVRSLPSVIDMSTNLINDEIQTDEMKLKPIFGTSCVEIENTNISAM